MAILLNSFMKYSPRLFSEGTKRDALWICGTWSAVDLDARASCCLATLRRENSLRLLILYETMNGMNEKTQESHEYKRQLRLIKRREQRRARLVRETNEQREQRLQRRREADRQRRRDANKVQCGSAEHRVHRLHVQNEGKHPICFRCKSLVWLISHNKLFFLFR